MHKERTGIRSIKRAFRLPDDLLEFYGVVNHKTLTWVMEQWHLIKANVDNCASRKYTEILSETSLKQLRSARFYSSESIAKLKPGVSPESSAK